MDSYLQFASLETLLWLAGAAGVSDEQRMSQR